MTKKGHKEIFKVKAEISGFGAPMTNFFQL